MIDHKKHEISVHELHEILEKDGLKNAILVDVRTPAEHREVAIKGAKNIPLDRLAAAKQELQKYDTVFLHCRSGGRSGKGCHMLDDLKETQVINVKGGILEWEAEGFHVNKKKGFHLPLIRQVHITAGLLVLTGVLLAEFLASPWHWLAAFVGAGLLFSGLTGWCGMAQLLAKMPWNR